MKQIALKLKESEQSYLENYVSKGTHSARAIRRARVLLALQAGK